MKRLIFAALCASAALFPAVSVAQEAETKAVTITVELPLEMTPTADEASLFTFIDANADNKAWAYRSNFGGIVSPSNDKADCDDWAITPGIRFNDVSSNYELAFTMKHNMRGPAFISSFEFYIGKSASVEAMTKMIGKIEDFYAETANVEYAQSIPFAIPDEAGVYYIGIRCVSSALHDGISPWPCTFRAISVKAMESSAAAPLQPTDVTVTPAEQGALSATVAFTMPTTAMNGKPLPEKELTATIASATETKTVKAMPGAPVSTSIATAQGNNEISLRVDGDLEGESLSFSVYTGVVLPMRIHDLAYTLSPDNMSMSLTWTAPTEGKDGGYVDFSSIDYVIYLNDGPEGTYQEHATTTDMSYTYTLEQGAKLRTVKLKVLPRNAAGVSDDDIAWVDQDDVYVQDMVGTPYALPAIERFDGMDMIYTPLTIQRPEGYSGRWYIGDPSEILADENHSALMAYNPYTEGDTKGRVALPKFSTLGGGNVALTLKVLRYSTYASNMYVYARNHDTDLTLLGTINCGAATDWLDVSYPLPAAFQGKDWVQIIIDVDLDDVDYVYAIDSYQLAVAAATDVAVLEVSSADTVEAGSPAKFKARIANLGFNAQTPAVKFSALDAAGTVLASSDITPGAIASGTETVVEWAYTPAAEQMDSYITVKAELTSADDVAANDVATAEFHVRRPALPVVTAITASTNDGAVHLQWEEPALHRTLVESFETAEDFAFSETLGAFTTFDGDGKSVYKFTNLSMPNEQLAKAFIVVNTTKVSGGDLEAHTGNKMLMATCPEMLNNVKPDPANDWLISPELVPGSYVSFYLDIISETYPESLRIMTSSTTAEPAAFTELDALLKAKIGWQQVEFRLPADAKYFAINYVSHDMFGIFVDDIKYVAANELHAVKNYIVYRDGALIGTTADTRYVDSNVVPGTTYTYHVTTLTDAESIKGATVSIMAEASGLEDLTAAGTARATAQGIVFDGCTTAAVYTTSGVALFQGTPEASSFLVPLAPGTYIAVADGRATKLVVR